jgi:hypothetical protein
MDDGFKDLVAKMLTGIEGEVIRRLDYNRFWNGPWLIRSCSYGTPKKALVTLAPLTTDEVDEDGRR